MLNSRSTILSSSKPRVTVLKFEWKFYPRCFVRTRSMAFPLCHMSSFPMSLIPNVVSDLAQDILSCFSVFFSEGNSLRVQTPP